MPLRSSPCWNPHSIADADAASELLVKAAYKRVQWRWLRYVA